MKYLLIIALTLTTLVSSVSANSWSFTKEDYNAMTKEQKYVLLMAKRIGEYHGLGNNLAKIVGVETRFGLIPSRNDRYCGPMQIAREYHDDITCNALEDNLYLSMEIAALEMKNWLKTHNNNLKKAFVSYNRGFMVSTHDEEYLRRINMVGVVLKSVGI